MALRNIAVVEQKQLGDGSFLYKVSATNTIKKNGRDLVWISFQLAQNAIRIKQPPKPRTAQKNIDSDITGWPTREIEFKASKKQIKQITVIRKAVRQIWEILKSQNTCEKYYFSQELAQKVFRAIDLEDYQRAERATARKRKWRVHIINRLGGSVWICRLSTSNQHKSYPWANQFIIRLYEGINGGRITNVKNSYQSIEINTSTALSMLIHAPEKLSELLAEFTHGYETQSECELAFERIITESGHNSKTIFTGEKRSLARGQKLNLRFDELKIIAKLTDALVLFECSGFYFVFDKHNDSAKIIIPGKKQISCARAATDIDTAKLLLAKANFPADFTKDCDAHNEAMSEALRKHQLSRLNAELVYSYFQPGNDIFVPKIAELENGHYAVMVVCLPHMLHYNPLLRCPSASVVYTKTEQSQDGTKEVLRSAPGGLDGLFNNGSGCQLMKQICQQFIDSKTMSEEARGSLVRTIRNTGMFFSYDEAQKAFDSIPSIQRRYVFSDQMVTVMPHHYLNELHTMKYMASFDTRITSRELEERASKGHWCTPFIEALARQLGGWANSDITAGKLSLPKDEPAYQYFSVDAVCSDDSEDVVGHKNVGKKLKNQNAAVAKIPLEKKPEIREEKTAKDAKQKSINNSHYEKEIEEQKKARRNARRRELARLKRLEKYGSAKPQKKGRKNVWESGAQRVLAHRIIKRVQSGIYRDSLLLYLKRNENSFTEKVVERIAQEFKSVKVSKTIKTSAAIVQVVIVGKVLLKDVADIKKLAEKHTDGVVLFVPLMEGTDTRKKAVIDATKPFTEREMY